jgi:hypothetical protein
MPSAAAYSNKNQFRASRIILKKKKKKKKKEGGIA